MEIDLEVYPELSLRLLTFISEKESQSEGSTRFLEYCSEEDLECYLYLEDENRLIVSESFRHAVRAEIREYIQKYRKQCKESPVNSETVNINNKYKTIYGGFCLFDSQKDTILWDLLTLLIFLDSLNPQIWDRRSILIGDILERKDLESDCLGFLISELNLTKLALCYAFKYGEIWCYLEYISMRYYKEIRGDKLNNLANEEIIEYVLSDYSHFINLQVDLYENSYYAWSCVNWLIYELIPAVISGEEGSKLSFSYKEILLFEHWIIKIIQRYPSQYGGYHALVNLNESKIEAHEQSKQMDTNLAIELVYPEETLGMLRAVIDCFSDSLNNCFTVILGFRYANFMLLIDTVDQGSHFKIFENEVLWFQKHGLVEKMSRSEKHLEELREHFYSILHEISSHENNKDMIQNFYNLLDKELQIVREKSTMFYNCDGTCPNLT
ncbi:hypothetical protein OIY81_1922 [Cryptosporidium canis]|uniref:Uncharacterized protein n=1 Tax=Cryptosporidium canis TaxID=195482 RepID=A0ABQ8PAK7_9CRYT|nr:hypothetical protein OIY81_1922 [Cryptosporidium canis]KAJ1614555.1 hypothetical protein OJ252_555 [Cryptosporidium canis]